MKTSDATQCLIGAILVKAGQALLLTWGKSNIYYYSYFKMNDESLSITYNTMPLAIIGLPLAILSVYSLKLADKIGYENLIKMSALIQLFSYLFALHAQTYFQFIMFYLIIVGCGYSLMGFPLLKCVWSHYSESEGMATGILFGIFGFATLFFILLVTFLVNPDNQEANEQIMVGQQIYLYFSEEVAKNTYYGIKYAGFIAGTLSVAGSLLINMNRQSNVVQQCDQFELFTIEDKQLELNRNNELMDVVKTSQFKIILISYFTVFYFEVTLGLNYKTYILSKVNNDQLITWVDTVGIILGSIANFIFGKMADKISFQQLLEKLLIMMGIFAFLLPITLNISKELFIIDFLILSILGKGVIVIQGPGLLQIFGKKIGAEIFPLINFSTLLGFICSALTSLLIVPIIRFDGTFLLQGGLIIIGGYLSQKLKPLQ